MTALGYTLDKTTNRWMYTGIPKGGEEELANTETEDTAVVGETTMAMGDIRTAGTQQLDALIPRESHRD